MLLSVIIITRNRSEVLNQCLNSIKSQTTPANVIVVDNASTDNTLEMLRVKHPDVSILPQISNMGIPGGRNIGIFNASTDLCMCIDDDAELIDPDSIKKCIDYFSKDPSLACLALRVVDASQGVVSKLIPRRDRKIIIEDTPGAMFSGTGFVFRRSAFLDVGGFWEDLSPYFGEEPEISYRVLDKGYKILHTPHVCVRHHESDIERDPERRLYYGTRNAPWIALRNLPWYSFLSLTVLSWGYFFIQALAKKKLRVFFRAAISSIKHWPDVYKIRSPIKASTRKALWKHSGLFIY